MTSPPPQGPLHSITAAWDFGGTNQQLMAMCWRASISFSVASRLCRVVCTASLDVSQPVAMRLKGFPSLPLSGGISTELCDRGWLASFSGPLFLSHKMRVWERSLADLPAEHPSDARMSPKTSMEVPVLGGEGNSRAGGGRLPPSLPSAPRGGQRVLRHKGVQRKQQQVKRKARRTGRIKRKADSSWEKQGTVRTCRALYQAASWDGFQKRLTFSLNEAIVLRGLHFVWILTHNISLNKSE